MLVFSLFSYIVFGIIFVAGMICLAYLPQLKGYVGERRIQKLLKSLGEDVKVYNDLYVPKKNGEMTQIDHVLLLPNGIFVIETKNYTGWIFGSEGQRNWTQTIYKKNHASTIRSCKIIRILKHCKIT